MIARAPSRVLVLATQIVIIVGWLTTWEFLPKIGDLANRTTFLDPYFISSPSRVWNKLFDLTTGRNGSGLIWPYVWPTLQAAILGACIGMSLGALFGLLLSNSVFWARVLKPMLMTINTIPRIALIPIIVILFGTSLTSTVIVSTMVVFFVSFFNAYEGGLSVQPQLIQNAAVLGANRVQMMRYIRLPYVLAWTMAALPPAVTFALLSVVTAEILTGSSGMGRIILISTVSGDSSLTFSAAVVLSILGLVVVGLAQMVKARALHWWAAG